MCRAKMHISTTGNQRKKNVRGSRGKKMINIRTQITEIKKEGWRCSSVVQCLLRCTEPWMRFPSLQKIIKMKNRGTTK